MHDSEIYSILANMIWVIVKVGAPALVASLIVGIVMAIVQAVTQINEQTMAFLPKFVAIGGMLFVSGSFMLGTLVAFTNTIFDNIIHIGGTR